MMGDLLMTNNQFLYHIPISRKAFPVNVRMQDLGQGARFFLCMEKRPNEVDEFYNQVEAKKIGVGSQVNVVCFDEDGTDYFWQVFIFQVERNDKSPKKEIKLIFEINKSSPITWH